MVKFSELNLETQEKQVASIEINGQEVQVKQYLPINDKLALVSNVINQARDDNNFPNPMKIETFFGLEIMFNYTDIDFELNDDTDLIELYDILKRNSVIDCVVNIIPKEEYEQLESGLWDCVAAIYEYSNSVRGIMEDLSTEYNQLSFDADELKNKIADPNNLTLLKNILDKELG